MIFRCKTMLFLETELLQVYYALAKVQYRTKKGTALKNCAFFLIVDDRLLVLTGRRISVQGRRIKLNFPSTAYLSSPHSIPLSVVLG